MAGLVTMETTYTKKYAIVGMRVLQLLAMALGITGSLWASSDWLLLTVLVSAPVTPLSVLLMLYGFAGSVICEAVIRLLSRAAKKSSAQQTS